MEDLVAKEKKRAILRVINSLKTQFNIDSKEIVELIVQSEGSYVPVEIFADRSLSSLQAIVKFLIENQGLTNTKVAKLLGRDTRTIWTTYNNAKKSKKSKFKIKVSEIAVPISLFQDRLLSVLEHIVNFLKNYGLSNHKIALLLKRSDTTISTVLKRVRVKGEKEK